MRRSAGHHNSDRARGSCAKTERAGPSRSRRSETARTRRPGTRTGGSPETRARRTPAGRRHRGDGPPGPGRFPGDPARSGEGRCQRDDGVRSSRMAAPSGPRSRRRADLTSPRHSTRTGDSGRQTSSFLRRVKRGRIAESAIARRAAPHSPNGCGARGIPAARPSPGFPRAPASPRRPSLPSAASPTRRAIRSRRWPRRR
jgi:hypothetical protein